VLKLREAYSDILQYDKYIEDLIVNRKKEFIFGIQKLPISQYPSVAAPTITLRATYPGASAQVMEDSVLAVIERNMYGVEGLDYMTTSANSSGSGSVVSLTCK